MAAKKASPRAGAPAYQCARPGMIDKRAARPGRIGACLVNLRVPSMISPWTDGTLSWAPHCGQKSASGATGRSQREQVCTEQRVLALPTVPAPEMKRRTLAQAIG